MMSENFEPPDDLRVERLGDGGRTCLLDETLRRFRWLWGAGLALAVGALLVVMVVSSSPRSSAPGIISVQPTITPGPEPILASQADFAALAVRPLDFSAVPSLAACPVSHGRQIDPSLGTAGGTGPLYIVLVQADGTVAYEPASQWGDTLGWGGMSLTLWAFPRNFSGPVLVRGKRLDAPGLVEFNLPGGSLEGAAQFTVFPAGGSGYQTLGGYYIRFNAPGCYGLQVDWLGGAERIIFRAEETAPAS